MSVILPSATPTAPPAGGATSRFVLVDTSHPGNVGAAARAMKVMGFDDLVLVAPRDPAVLADPQAVSRASGATDVLAAARVVPTLAQALSGITFVCATAMTPRDFGPPTAAPRTLMADLAPRGHHVAFVFGGERFGLGNDEVYRCHAAISIPTAPGYGSLNLAQAVQIVAYEWRQALGGFDVVPRAPDRSRADQPMLDGVMDHWTQVLTTLGFFDPAVPRRLLPRLRRLLLRGGLRQDEAHILRGIATAIQRGLGDRRGG